jgi:predicted amidohydrolase YtcJ
MKVWEGDSLAQAARRVDELGFQIHIHAIGDAAVRQALDAIEYAIESNGPRDRRPVIAHVQLVDDADLERFAKLGVIPCMQPLWAQMDALMTVLTIPGASADLVWLDRDPRETPALELPGLGIRGTYLRGELGRPFVPQEQ